MATQLTKSSGPQTPGTSLVAKLVNMFVSPTDVFDEVVVARPATANWLAPTLLACLTLLLVPGIFNNDEQTTTTVHKLVTAGKLTQTQADTLANRWYLIAGLFSCTAVVLGTVWSAFVLWVMGRAF